MEEKILDSLTEEQQAFLKNNCKTMNEQDLFQKVLEIGPKVEEDTFSSCLSAAVSDIENAVFGENTSEDEETELVS